MRLLLFFFKMLHDVLIPREANSGSCGIPMSIAMLKHGRYGLQQPFDSLVLWRCRRAIVRVTVMYFELSRQVYICIYHIIRKNEKLINYLVQMSRRINIFYILVTHLISQKKNNTVLYESLRNQTDQLHFL